MRSCHDPQLRGQSHNLCKDITSWYPEIITLTWRSNCIIIIIIISGFGIYGAAVVPDSGVGNTCPGVRDNRSTINTKTGYDDDDDELKNNNSTTLSSSSSSRMRVMNHNWSATKQHLHLQSVAEISCHSVLSGDRIRQCETSSGSRHKDTDQCL